LAQSDVVLKQRSKERLAIGWGNMGDTDGITMQYYPIIKNFLNLLYYVMSAE
jgi:hypothetical protein